MCINKPKIILERVPAGLENKISKLRQLALENNFETVQITRHRQTGNLNFKINRREKRNYPFFKFVSSAPSDSYTVAAYTHKDGLLATGVDIFSIKCKQATPSKVFEKVSEAFDDALKMINEKRIKSGLPPITKAEKINQAAQTAVVQQKNKPNLISRIKNFFKP